MMETKTATSTKWLIDASHSEISFKVKHLVITTVTGRFKEFSGSLISGNNDFRGAEVEFIAKTNSIDTGVESRDNHLKSPDFFDVAAFPEIHFKSTGFIKESEENYLLTGDLTIRDITRPVKLQVEYSGAHKDPFSGKLKAGFELTGKINRKQFGLQWDVLTEAGGAVVGEDVKILCHIQIMKDAE